MFSRCGYVRGPVTRILGTLGPYSLVADDGAVVYLNGTEVVRDNLPAGVLTDATLAPSYRTGAAEEVCMA